VRENLAEVQPHVVFAVPRVWEKLWSSVELRIRDSSWGKRRAYAWALEVGRCVARARRERAEPQSADSNGLPRGLALRHALADRIVLRPLRQKLGLERVRYALSGAAPISPEVVAYFQAIGVPLVEGYGMTEASSVICACSGYRTPGDVGKPVPGLALELAEDGEILVSSPGVMLGYYRDELGTSQTLRDGFLRTGDLGERDAQGRIRITARKRDLIVITGGRVVAPDAIESRLRTSPYIHDALLIGHGRTHLTALLVLDEDNLLAWARAERIQFSGYAELVKNERIASLVTGELDKINAASPPHDTIRQFRILERPPLDMARHSVALHYKELIDSMYAD
jgi:long-chain acyl-CoA synthetase